MLMALRRPCSHPSYCCVKKFQRSQMHQLQQWPQTMDFANESSWIDDKLAVPWGRANAKRDHRFKALCVTLKRGLEEAGSFGKHLLLILAKCLPSRQLCNSAVPGSASCWAPQPACQPAMRSLRRSHWASLKPIVRDLPSARCLRILF